MKVRVRFTEPLLGSANNNPEIHEEFIANRSADAEKVKEEMAALDPGVVVEKAMTVFMKDAGGLILWDYQVRGFFKEAIALIVDTTVDSGDDDETPKAEKKKKSLLNGLTKWGVKRAVDSLVFPVPRKIPLLDAAGVRIPKATLGLQRPLRAETMQGPRVALANSEMLPEGTQLVFELKILEATLKSRIRISPDLIRAALDYGALKGFGQWRSGGYGRFSWSEE